MTVLVAEQQRAQNLLLANTVLEKGKLELIKAFLQFSKHVHNAAVLVSKLVKFAVIVSEMEKYKATKILQ